MKLWAIVITPALPTINNLDDCVIIVPAEWDENIVFEPYLPEGYAVHAMFVEEEEAKRYATKMINAAWHVMVAKRDMV